MGTNHYKVAGGPIVIQGMGTFVTTSVNYELAVGTLKRIKNINLTPVATPNANDVLGVSETMLSDGTLVVPSNGNITIKRVAAGTSALKFHYRIEGES
jgi:hypothetical protein